MAGRVVGAGRILGPVKLPTPNYSLDAAKELYQRAVKYLFGNSSSKPSPSSETPPSPPPQSPTPPPPTPSPTPPSPSPSPTPSPPPPSSSSPSPPPPPPSSSSSWPEEEADTADPPVVPGVSSNLCRFLLFFMCLVYSIERVTGEVRDFERNGLNLSSTKKDEVQRLQALIDDLSMQYIHNLNDDNTFLLFTETELEGLPNELLKILDRANNDKVKITLKSNHVLPVLELCKVGATRRKVAVAYGQRCKDVNVPLLENLVLLRHKFARLLGYDNYAEYVVCSRMAKTSSKVFEFLEDLSMSLSELATKELETLKNLKRKEEESSPFGIEDLLYYVKKYEEENFSVDFGALKEYFPLSLVLQGIFKIVQDLFGLRFEEIVSADVWHDDVRVFSVFDLSSGELMGYVYLDLYSREEKYSQTCVLPLQNGSLSSNGARQVPVVLLMTQLLKEDIDSPVVLRFSEVVSLFHEFGHVAHHLCNLTSLVRFSGLRVDPDLLEIPGHMFENWCYESSILKLISGYYQDITRPIKDDICTSIRRWRQSFSALKLMQEILYCLFDQIIYSADNVDLLEVFKFLHPKVMLGLPFLEGTNPASCFPHSAVGYEASCYSRIWSKVFAADLYASKFHDGILNHHIGMQFRNKVLAPGGAKDPLECLTNFLGREPSIQAFVDSIALSSV